MTAEEKLACQRLSVLELAQALGRVSEACGQRVLGFDEENHVCQACDGVDVTFEKVL